MGRKRIFSDEERKQQHRDAAKRWRARNRKAVEEYNKKYYASRKREEAAP